MTISRILVPTDFSDDAGRAFTYAMELAAVFGASIHLLHVVENPLGAGMWSAEICTPQIAGLEADLVKDAEQRLRRSIPAGTQRISPEIRTGNAVRQILEAARDGNVDLIVMGTRGRTGLAHMLMGSVAERVVRLANCPVLTLHAGAGIDSSAPSVHVNHNIAPSEDVAATWDQTR